MNAGSKILFFDIDGTLVGFDGKMPDSTGEALLTAKHNGHQLILCTGRSRCQMHERLFEYGFDGVIGAAGAYVEYHGEVVSHKVIKPAALRKYVNCMEEHGIMYGLQSAGSMVATRTGADAIGRIFREQFGATQEQIGRILSDIRITEKPGECRDIEKMIYYASPVGLNEMQRILSPEFDVTVTSFEKPDDTTGEVTSAGITKAYGMQKLLDYLKAEREDTVSFGDGPNDLEMLRFAGTGVAMGNAGENVKKIADIVTDRIDQDGIYKAMELLHLL